jgi:PHD/YefM family antitoxin component YafN of YafNO toxin-antitoxin module
MIVYTYSEARQNLASLLEKAAKEGEVRIKRKDGQIFVIKPQPPEDYPLDVKGVDLDITTSEILQALQEGRRTF